MRLKARISDDQSATFSGTSLGSGLCCRIECGRGLCKELVCCRADSGDLWTIQTLTDRHMGRLSKLRLHHRESKAVAHMAAKHSVCVNTSSTGIQMEINIYFYFFNFYTIRTPFTDRWPGDLAPHNVWSTNKEENNYVIERLMNLIQQYFPKTPVYATLGNHEAHPSDT